MKLQGGGAPAAELTDPLRVQSIAVQAEPSTGGALAIARR